MTNQELLDLFPIKAGDERIPWKQEGQNTGFSILRDFPSNSSFKPARNENGVPDNTILLRIGFYHKDIKEGSVPLFVDISTASRYNFKGKFFDNDNDPDKPTAESVAESERSTKPINLTEHGRFVFNFEDNSIFDTHDKRTLNMDGLVEYSFKLFLKTASWRGWSIRSKMFLANFISNFFLLILLGCWDLLSFIGKKINKQKGDTFFGLTVDRENFHFWPPQDPYSIKDLVSTGPQFGLLGSEFKVSKGALLIISVLVVLSVILFDFFGTKNGFLGFLGRYEHSQIFVASILVLTYVAIDNLLPWILVRVINFLLPLKSKLLTMKFPFY